MSKALPFRLILVMAVACGFSIANIYYNQPLLGLLQREWGASPLIGLIPAMTQLGFAFGLILLVPLGDAMDRKRLILAQTLALIASLACMAASPTPPLLLLASVLVGATATIAQQIIPFAAELAGPEQRGKVVGHVMSGLLSGILLARTLSGFAGAYLGWRAMFMVGAALAIAMGLMLLAFLPSSKPTAQHGYPALLASLFKLAREERELRYAILTQGMLFAAFSAFWSTLVLLLQQPEFHMGSREAGLFGIIGLVGVLLAPQAGKLADARGPHGIVKLGIALVVASFLVFGVAPNLMGLVVGVILLDAGVQVAMVSHQTIIFALNPAARSRINTVYMTGLFVAGALGSAIGGFCWQMLNWNGVAAAGFALGVLSTFFHLGMGSPQPSRQTGGQGGI
ncbi:MFS transporter [Chromobacterium violaceum]|nr:MFS transporter [Chromobacterium violaceum]KJH67069.1 MFS transporter [Chromobacterium violaceum]MCD0493172.1 MFS transporter [Chromobacterium violaceum]OQS12161.1 MFS transporter [Chromobacterium violaceum]OQS28403.1 MFS transporter [Chromobacterium violaceum]OQS51175.1 MFS transporter [Chromobacterium violaceum]